MNNNEQNNVNARIRAEGQKLGKKAILGYGFASAADSTAYNFVFMFLLYFLTTAAGINPAAAGTILMVATLVDAFTTPLIGYLSDNCMAAAGRRRPFILVGGIACAITAVLLFTCVPLSGTAKVVYYVVFTILFWVSYSTWYVPYTAFGAEIAIDYDSRTKLRVPATIFNGLGNLIGMSAPMVVMAMLVSAGFSQNSAWTGFAAILGCIVLVTILLTWGMTRGRELRPSDEELRKQKEQGLFSTYFKVLRLKPYKFMAIAAICFIAAYTFMMTDIIYYITCVMQQTETVQSQVTLVLIIAGIVLTPAVSAVAVKIEKKQAVVVCFLTSAIGMLVLRMIGIQSVAMLDLYIVIFTICNCAYWTLIPAMAYDMSEVYEAKYKEQREGAVLSLNVFFIKVSAAITSGVTGNILAFSGYDAAREVQSESAIAGITNLFTTVPAVFLIIAAVIMAFFPLTKKRHEMLIERIDEQKCDEAIPEELKKVL